MTIWCFLQHGLVKDLPRWAVWSFIDVSILQKIVFSKSVSHLIVSKSDPTPHTLYHICCRSFHVYPPCLPAMGGGGFTSFLCEMKVHVWTDGQTEHLPGLRELWTSARKGRTDRDKDSVKETESDWGERETKQLKYSSVSALLIWEKCHRSSQLNTTRLLLSVES